MRKIKLTHGFYATIDDKDYKSISKYNWSLYVNSSNKRSVYPRTYIKGTTFFMHQLLKPKKDGFVIDHRNKNGLDNRRKNLRYVTFSENAVNSRIGKNNSSGYTGVNKQGNLWRARIWKDWKCIELGNYNTFKEAKKVRIKAENKYFHKIIVERKQRVRFHQLKRTPVPDIKRYSNATTKYKGVYPAQGCINRWKAHITIKGKIKYIGAFGSEVDAAKAFIEEFKNHYGVVPYEL